uniref:WGS project CBMG000000000 data, contig CS5907-c000987 n=1 Tax=Fusarium acuminatum CS5907 TaxID=1318461 RepID=A0A096PEG5_9HYPO|nr:unnamed protein product [Fusarium acuminatum CS5907]
MEFSSAFTFRRGSPQQENNSNNYAPLAPKSTGTNCPHFAGFMAVCFAEGHNERGFHPVITSTTPNFQDISLGGGSFDVRKVEASSFPSGLSDSILKNRKYLAVKHPRVQDDNMVSFGDIALELQILRHPPIQQHENIVNLLAVMYHDTGNEEGIRVVPALVLEYAEHGSLKAFQEAGYARSLEERLNIALDTARGLEALHGSGIVHGDIKPSNLLIFKHPTRNFIVKLSDFGFAIPMQGGQLIGCTEMYSAPETDGGQLRSQYLLQQDVYSFGLTLWTILSDGIPFFSSFPDGERLENVNKMKKSNILSSIAAMNILHRLRNEIYPIMALIKVIFTSLQLSPSKRFSRMSKIINHLEITQSIVRSRNGHDTPYAEGLRNTFYTFQKVVSEAKLPVSDGERGLRVLLNGIATHTLAYLSKSLFGAQGPVMSVDPQQLCSLMAQFLPKAHQQFYSLFDRVEMPMMNALEMVSSERIHKVILELSSGMDSPNEDDRLRSFSATNACQVILDCVGFLPEPVNNTFTAGPITRSASTPLHLFHDEEFIPNITKSSNILKKAPKLVRIALAESLKNIFTASTSQTEKAHASLNLAYAYADDIGLEYDLKLVAHHVLQAAHLGLEKARTLYISVFSQVSELEAPDEETMRTWVLESAHARSPTALRKLKDSWPSDWQQVTQKAQQEELTRIGISADVVEELTSMLQSLSLADIDTSRVRNLFLWSVVTDNPEVTVSCLNQSPELAGIALQHGETPLLVAARLGHKRVLETILEHPNCGNVADAADERGITAFHWLCSFADEDHESVSSLLFNKGADLNSPACAIALTHYGIEVLSDSLLTYTPLHWAVVQDQLSAVDTLIKLGADLNFCMEVAEGETSNRTPLELACALWYSSIVSRLLQEPSLRLAADALKPMVNGKDVMYRPLFHVIGGGPRWQPLCYLGVEFEAEARKTMKALIDSGASTDAVLQVGDVKMPAVFATAYHQCSADLMVSGLELGFADQIDATFGGISSGGNALFLAITHGDRAMFKALIDAGADVTVVDKVGLNPLHRAAKETDDVYFVGALLEKGLPVDPPNQEVISAFSVAVWAGNLTIAKYLYDQGADIDRVPTTIKTNIMGEMLFRHTRNALRRIKFLLSLPDRDGSDGFMIRVDEETRYSLLHLAIPCISEFAQDKEITGIIIAEILRRYHSQEQLDNKEGPYQTTALAMAAEGGNYFVARRLLEYGANPNIPDQLGRTALDLVHTRYCFPEKFVAAANVDCKDDLAVAKILKAVNENTSELMGLLSSYKAEIRTWKPPPWLEEDPGHRSLEWVLECLREDYGDS